MYSRTIHIPFYGMIHTHAWAIHIRSDDTQCTKALACFSWPPKIPRAHFLGEQINSIEYSLASPTRLWSLILSRALSLWSVPQVGINARIEHRRSSIEIHQNHGEAGMN